ncbi:MAG: hypothetical protein QGG98_00255 [Pseudomonadales bacterium]|nr:hypothetical protein [Pseudomonadales bacterium]
MIYAVRPLPLATIVIGNVQEAHHLAANGDSPDTGSREIDPESDLLLIDCTTCDCVSMFCPARADIHAKFLLDYWLYSKPSP